ncbi:hypothetical protein D3C85_281030 [compost metagenome]
MFVLVGNKKQIFLIENLNMSKTSSVKNFIEFLFLYSIFFSSLTYNFSKYFSFSTNTVFYVNEGLFPD